RRRRESVLRRSEPRHGGGRAAHAVAAGGDAAYLRAARRLLRRLHARHGPDRRRAAVREQPLLPHDDRDDHRRQRRRARAAAAAQPVRLAEVVDGVAESFRPLVERKGLALRVACDADLPTLMTDGEKVERILRNLLANALKFTDHGSIRLEARLGDAESFAGFTFIHEMADGGRPPDGRTVAVLVRDTGIGIRGADVAALAADFQQVDTEAAARFGGTGLGLSISRKLVELLGGRIGV